MPSSDLCWVQVAPEPAALLSKVWTFLVLKCEQKKRGTQQVKQTPVEYSGFCQTWCSFLPFCCGLHSWGQRAQVWGIGVHCVMESDELGMIHHYNR